MQANSTCKIYNCFPLSSAIGTTFKLLSTSYTHGLKSNLTRPFGGLKTIELNAIFENEHTEIDQYTLL